MYDITNDKTMCIWLACYKLYEAFFIHYIKKNLVALYRGIFCRNLLAAVKYI